MRTLFYNGDILTMVSPCPAEALLVEGDRILAVGDLSAIGPLAGRQARVIDLEGGALLPAFADCGGDAVSLLDRRLSGAGGTGRAVRRALREVSEAYAARGITAPRVWGATAEAVRLLAHSDLPTPWQVTADIADYEAVKRAAACSRGRVRVVGVSLDLDVWGDGDEPTGLLAYCDRAVGLALRLAAAERVRPLARAACEASAAQFLRVMRAMSRVCPSLMALRPILWDARCLSPLAPEETRRLGVTPCFAADIIPRRGDEILAARGPEAAARLTPYAAAREAGVPYALCGTAGEIPDPLALLAAAVSRRSARGIVLGGGERASVYEAMRALTVHGAWRDGEERERGSLRAGMRADMAVLDRSPLSVPTRDLRALRLRAVFAGGEAVFVEKPADISTLRDRVPSVYHSFTK